MHHVYVCVCNKSSWPSDTRVLSFFVLLVGQYGTVLYVLPPSAVLVLIHIPHMVMYMCMRASSLCLSLPFPSLPIPFPSLPCLLIPLCPPLRLARKELDGFQQGAAVPE